MRVRSVFLAGVVCVSASLPAVCRANCSQLPDKETLTMLVASAPSSGGTVGGLFGGARVSAAVVDRRGKLCALVSSTTQVQPAAAGQAQAKAYTANAFSTASLPFSTARLYTFAQPGHSLYGLDPRPSKDKAAGIVTVGGGVPLYSSGEVIGGLGIAGDTSCADHEMAKRVRNLAGLNPPGGPLVDDITYSSVDGASVFTHPRCISTFRNGVALGGEAPAAGY